MPVAEQVAILWAGANGHLDNVPVDRVREFERDFLEYLRNAHPEVLEKIRSEKELSDEVVKMLEAAVQGFTPSQGGKEAA
jgi:F-type H+-transporting ATPase subunit alpha